jgi:uncharacterized small protein (DUF1192 family)
MRSGSAVIVPAYSSAQKCVAAVLGPGLVCDTRVSCRYFIAGGEKMPAIDPDDLPKKKITHEMGQDLALLSVGELAERVSLLKEEIARLEAEMARKRASQTAADAFFKK